MIDVEAIQVKKYAVENPNEDLDPEHQAQAGQEPSLPAAAAPIGDVVDDAAEGQKRPTLEHAFESAEAKKARIGIEQPITPPLGDAMDPSDERAAKTPRVEESPRQQQMMQVTSTDLDLYEHEDRAVQFDFHEAD